MTSSFKIRLATAADAKILGTIGPAIYAENYGDMWSNARNYAQFLDSFGTAAFSDFMRRPDAKIWVALESDIVIGFLSLILGSPDPITGRTSGAEVPRIYLLSPSRGRGLGKLLLREAESFAGKLETEFLWLDAMKSAPWAWQTYLKWGFHKIGITEFTEGIGAEHKSMIVLKKQISAL